MNAQVGGMAQFSIYLYPLTPSNRLTEHYLMQFFISIFSIKKSQAKCLCRLVQTLPDSLTLSEPDKFVKTKLLRFNF